MTREEIILSRVKVENGSVSICQDERLGMLVKERMLDHSWSMYTDDVGEYMMSDFDNSGKKDSLILSCEGDFQVAEQFKDLVWEQSPGTKHRFVKIILNKIFWRVNKKQRAVNNAIISILGNLTGTLSWVKEGLFSTDEKANRALEEINRTKIEIENYETDTYNCKIEIDNLRKNELKTHRNDINALFHSIKEAEEKIDRTSNNAQFNSNVLSEHNYRISSLERMLDNMTYRGQSTGADMYSQSGEDGIIKYIIERFMIPFREVRYLDLGANHASYLSNTYYFYLKKARGVLVEANPQMISELEDVRQGDVILNRCISNRSDEVIKFYILNKDGLSSLDFDSVKEAMSRDESIEIVDTIEIKTISVNDIIEQYFNGEAPTFINLDLEGIELDVLRSIDFERYRPLIFVIETIPYRTELVIDEKETEIVEYMKKVGYVEYAFTGINSVFVDERKLKNN